MPGRTYDIMDNSTVVSELKQNCLNLQSWDKFTFAALFHTRRTVTREFIYTCSAPPPPTPPTMLDTCTHYFSRVSTLYSGRGGRQRILKRITELF